MNNKTGLKAKSKVRRTALRIVGFFLKGTKMRPTRIKRTVQYLC